VGIVCLATLLSGCDPSGKPTVGGLPAVRADIQACFRQGAGDIPDRALSIADVEALWKAARVRIVVMQRCGKRFLAWYEALRANWK
jgi:hypothetical protein